MDFATVWEKIARMRLMKNIVSEDKKNINGANKNSFQLESRSYQETIVRITNYYIRGHFPNTLSIPTKRGLSKNPLKRHFEHFFLPKVGFFLNSSNS